MKQFELQNKLNGDKDTAYQNLWKTSSPLISQYQKKR